MSAPRRGLALFAPLAAMVAAVGGALAASDAWAAPLWALALLAALALGFAAGWTRARRDLPAIADAVAAVARGGAAPAAPEDAEAPERAVFAALAAAREELGRRARDGALARDQAALDGRRDAAEQFAAAVAGRFAQALAAADAALAAAGSAGARGDAPRALDGLATARRALREAGRLVAGLRALAPEREPALSTLPLADVLRRVVEERRPRAEAAGIALALELADPRAAQASVPAALAEAVGPLIDNALDALEARPPAAAGAAKRAGAPAETRGAATIAARREGRGIVVLVEDDGPGFGAAALARAFDPLFTTRAAGDGLGLGLPIARAAAAKCGARLELADRAQGGARAVLRLGDGGRDAASDDPRSRERERHEAGDVPASRERERDEAGDVPRSDDGTP